MKHIPSKYEPTQLENTPTEFGQSLEEMLRDAVENNTPIECKTPMIYTDKADGVLPECDIRTDRQELAIEATSKWDKTMRAKTDNAPEVEKTETT